jgi:hypothetical protein
MILLKKLHENSTEPEALDNIVAATCRIVEFQFLTIPAEQRPADYAAILDSIFDKIPFLGDVTENETILKFAFKLYEQDQALCLKYMEKIAITCIKVICDERCRDDIKSDFRQKVGQFVKIIVT